MDTADSIKERAWRLDKALEAKDVGSVLTCFAKDCEVELLGVKVKGRDGVRRWLRWLFTHVRTISFEPRAITVEGEEFFEEFVTNAILPSGSQVRSLQAEVLSYRNGEVVSLRLYFNPLDFARAAGFIGRLSSPLLTRLVRRGLWPYEEID